MAALSKILRSVEGGRLMFWCPGCDSPHAPMVGDGPGPRWQWNGDVNKPTFQPSILVRYDHWVPSAADPEIAAKIRNGEIKQTLVKDICHSFVREGRIQFLGDCTHALAGQTVDLPEFDAA